MKIKLIIFFLFAFLVNLSLSTAATYIVGEVADAEDGTSANDHAIIIWNLRRGMQDNITDIIGPNGDSGTNNVYLINCEELGDSCSLGDEIAIKVIDNGDGYITNTKKIIIHDSMNIAPALQLIKKKLFLLS